MNHKKIALFASGSGTNAQNFIQYFLHHKQIQVDSLWSNKSDAYALTRAQNLGVETFVFSREELRDPGNVMKKLEERGIDLIVLAGFLWLIPARLTKRFRIVNIHPALLPKYGGKGMYGMHVHRKVIESGDRESGITIHLVNEVYDEGKVLFQARCEVVPGDTPEDVAEKVHQLEYKHFPMVIEKLLLSEQ